MTDDNSILAGNKFKFIPYNTGMPTLLLPEYGRNIQNMIDYCVEIENPEERQLCAYAIIAIMKQIAPPSNGDKNDDKKYWDHLNIMSRFELDIEFPCEVITAETVNPKPNPIPIGKSPIKYRHYGRNIENIVKIVATMEDSEDKDRLISMCAHQMKKLLLNHNPEGVDNARILRDLCEYSDGKINLDADTYILHDFRDITPVTAGKTKKGRKKKK